MATELTQHEEVFAQKFFECSNASDAFRAAYNTANMKPSTIHRRAHSLRTREKVIARVAELNAASQREVLWSRAKSIEVLADIALKDTDKAGNDIKATEKISAIRELNSMHGWKSETVDNVSSDGSMSPDKLSDEDLAQSISDLLGNDEKKH